MSQNAVLDREAVNIEAQIVSDREVQPVARLQREHLTLMDWDRSAPAAVMASAVHVFAPVVPARRPWFGWSEAGTGLLLLAAGAACLSSLLNF